ncbi:hypothetical protein RFI_28801 [Reticulomyxa filosa]|uniref:Uncharacterized protein n=1 Tax=Reticulomyxa filosa TaxID=46433 RepID=X6M3N3_RETFI|nr:hypothetical protein RFI_28801 [Reticulomyxa filosa]|eukprot:ETO08583.1 hypothetical protein RFI_28801 [Reticulomyxa filosa]
MCREHLHPNHAILAITTTIKKVDGIYDRGSLVALEPSQRADYIKFFQKILAKDGKILLSVLRYEPEARWKNIENHLQMWQKELAQTKISSRAEELTKFINRFLVSKDGNIEKTPYSFTKEEITKLFEPITKGNPNKIKLLASVKWSESDDPHERNTPKRLLINDDNTFLDIYLIENGK